MSVHIEVILDKNKKQKHIIIIYLFVNANLFPDKEFVLVAMIPSENCLKRRLSEPEAFILELFAPHEKEQKV